jgi:hypothetical protein
MSKLVDRVRGAVQDYARRSEVPLPTEDLQEGTTPFQKTTKP